MKKETVNFSVMPDTCCGKYEEEQPLKSIRDKLNPQLTQIGKEPQYITNARESFKCKKEDVIGFDVIERHNKKCFDDTLENIKKSMKDKGQLLKSTEEIPDLSKATEEQKRDSIQEVVELVSKTLLKVFIAFDLKNHIETMIINDATKKEYVLTFETANHFRERFYQSVNDITNTLPYPNSISKHQTDINIGWMRAMKYMKNL